MNGRYDYKFNVDPAILIHKKYKSTFATLVNKRSKPIVMTTTHNDTTISFILPAFVMLDEYLKVAAVMCFLYLCRK
jgi:hypothetical protein